MSKSKQAYLLRLFRSLLRGVSTDKICPVVADYSLHVEESRNDRMGTLCQEFGSPQIITQRVQHNVWKEAPERRFYWKNLATTVVLLAITLALVFVLYRQYHQGYSRIFPLLLCLNVLVLPFVLWFFSDRGILLRTPLAKGQKDKRFLLWQGALLFVALLEQITVTYLAALIFRSNTQLLAAKLIPLSQCFILLGFLGMAFALYRYLHSGLVYSLAIFAQSLGILLSAWLLPYQLALMVAPWTYTGFPIAPYYVSLALSLLYFATMNRKRGWIYAKKKKEK